VSESIEVGDLRRRLGRQLAERRKATGYTQSALAPLTGYARSTVANVEIGRQHVPRDFWQRCDQALGTGSRFTAAFDVLRATIQHERDIDARAAQVEREHRVRLGPAVDSDDHRDQQETDVRQRTSPPRDLTALGSHAPNLVDLRHIAAAMEDAHRYFDGAVLELFRNQLATCASEDGAQGPRATLPKVLGVVGVIEHSLRHVKPHLRQDLLAVGAHAAEFAGWLYRDSGEPGLADYWRDRAMEWAQAANDSAMQGYILLKKSQVAWDQRDAVRMLTLAQAVQAGAWQLPRTVQAEAAQQAARGHAMLGDSFSQIERQLDSAHRILADDDDTDHQVGIHYRAALLAMQTAICYQQAGQPQRATAIYREQLTKANFSRRDYGYFMALNGSALASAREPDEAARVGLIAHTIATHTYSTRTTQELGRLVRQLDPWARRPIVCELRKAVLSY